MAVIHWIVTNKEGEMVGDKCQVNVSSKIYDYNNFIPPKGYIKALISYDDYVAIESSFNNERKIYEKYIDTIESKAIDLTEEQKIINESRAKPNKYRERLTKDGRMILEFYDENELLIHSEIVALQVI